jgi:2-polyprenyl-6-methoxyphenol hydroxylase-like FAD-dependent oxidoreductase
MKAIVIGGGWSGALAAVGLSPFFDQITVLERDDLRALRRVSAQSAQLHNLLTGGLRATESLLPGFRDHLLASGATIGEVSSDTHVFEAGMWMPQRPLGLAIASAPRRLFEQTAWHLLQQHQHIVLKQGFRVTELTLNKRRTTGVRGIDSFGRSQELFADLIVDASGGRFKRPKEIRVPVTSARPNRWYASCQISRPEAFQNSNEFWLVFPWTGTRGTLISPLPHNRWHISISGDIRIDSPPGDWTKVLSYVEGLDDPTRELPRLLGQASIEHDIASNSKIAVYRQPVAMWHRLDLWKEPPLGFCAVGDAIARQVPLTGQGLSVAAKQAVALRLAAKNLSKSTSEHAEREAMNQYVTAATEYVRQSWNLQTVFQAPAPSIASSQFHSSSPRPINSDIVADLIQRDSEFHAAYVGLWHHITPLDVLTKQVEQKLRGRFGSIPE